MLTPSSILILILLIFDTEAAKKVGSTTEAANTSNTTQPAFSEFGSLSGGLPVPPGLFASLVVFLRRRGVPRKKAIEGDPPDSSVFRFLCSGTLLNRRWILTRAKPLVYYSYKEYWMIAESHFIPSSLNETRKYAINWIEYYRKFEGPEDVEFDVALARTNKEISFSYELRAVNLGIPKTREGFKNCHLVVWDWPSRNRYDDYNARRVAIPVTLKNGGACELAKSYSPGDYSNHFGCFTLNKKQTSQKFREPCAVNLGAPVVCDMQLLWGMYVGRGGQSHCRTSFKPEYEALSVYADNSTIFRWIREVLNNVDDIEDDDLLEHFEVIFNNETLLDERGLSFNATDGPGDLYPLFRMCKACRACHLVQEIQNVLLLCLVLLIL